MTNDQKSRYNYLMNIAKGDYMSEQEFEELLFLFKQIGK